LFGILEQAAGCLKELRKYLGAEALMEANFNAALKAAGPPGTAYPNALPIGTTCSVRLTRDTWGNIDGGKNPISREL
jgi:hypothetical protein